MLRLEVGERLGRNVSGNMMWEAGKSGGPTAAGGPEGTAGLPQHGHRHRPPIFMLPCRHVASIAVLAALPLCCAPIPAPPEVPPDHGCAKSAGRLERAAHTAWTREPRQFNYQSGNPTAAGRNAERQPQREVMLGAR